MRQLLLGGLTLAVHLYLFLALGSLTLRILGREKKFSWCFVPVLGLFVYYGLFELLALPMTLLLVPLHVLTAAWGLSLGVVALAAVFLCGRMWLGELKRLRRVLGEHRLMTGLLFLLVLVQLIYVAAYDQNTADAAFYVGNVSTSVFTDTLGRFDPYTGNMYRTFNVRYVTATFYLDTAVYSVLSGVHPMILAKTIHPMQLILLVNLTWYRLGFLLFDGERRRAAGFLAAAVFFQLFVGNPNFSAFLYYRAYEGKAMLQGLVIPFLLLLCLELYRNPREKLAKWGLFFTSLGAVALTTSSVTLVPAAVLAGTLRRR